MTVSITGEELDALIERVFHPTPDDRRLAILVDLPDDVVPDNDDWKTRRELARDWALALSARQERSGRSMSLVLYRNARANNADLPARAWVWGAQRVATQPLPASADDLDPAETLAMSDVLATHSLVLAPTEFSATAPLKIAAPTHGLSAATMPGFLPSMIPALRLDYGEINRRCEVLKDLLDRAERARFVFVVDGTDRHELTLDLRYRTAHASGGLIRERGKAGNLPSGETYIVPYEGEQPREPSRSAGTLPVQFEDEVVVYRVVENRAVEVVHADRGGRATSEATRLRDEPAYGNIAELGLGVLDAFGVEPCGEVLLDEKLGLHIAFGRSEHFGGQVGPSDFSAPDKVVHIDRVYVPLLQPRVTVRRVALDLPDEREIELMRDGSYAITF
jgi:hypothetical protein